MYIAASIIVALAIGALACIGLGGFLHYRYGSKVQRAADLVVEELKK